MGNKIYSCNSFCTTPKPGYSHNWQCITQRRAVSQRDDQAKYGIAPIQIFSAYDSLVLRLEIRLRLWRRSEAKERHRLLGQIRRNARVLQSFARAYPIGRAASLRLQGDIEALTDHPDRAQKCYLAGITAARKTGMMHDEAMTC